MGFANSQVTGLFNQRPLVFGHPFSYSKFPVNGTADLKPQQAN
jgi:hypothetical protein